MTGARQMETTPPIQTLTDELLGEIERKASSKQIEGFALVHNLDCVAVVSLITELRTLRAQVKALQSDANSWQSGYDEGRRMSGKHRLSEIEQLRAENAELRKDAGRLDWLADLNSPAQVMLPCQFVLENIHSMRDAIDQCRAAMEQAK